MIRFNVYNLIFDFRDFVRNNRVKLIVIAAVNLLGLILGIRGAFSVYDAGEYLYHHQPNVFMYIAGKKSIFGYFFVNMITYLLVLALLVLCSAHFLTSYLCFAILFFRSYLFALHVCLYFMFLKLSVLPFVLACLLPCYLISMFIFAIVTVAAFNRARDARLYGSGCGNTFALFAQRMILPCIMLIIQTILCTILSYFLTLGIIL
ncbi:MAG: hypothetical protein HFE47_03855 [Clostridia bacterium]|nr:hypothetical protein [Clostridia bacterium]